MAAKTLANLKKLLKGVTFTVGQDFFSVWGDLGGSGFEVAGKIGERAIAKEIAKALNEVFK